jgi:hypothetical protein
MTGIQTFQHLTDFRDGCCHKNGFLLSKDFDCALWSWLAGASNQLQQFEQNHLPPE